MQWVLQHHAAMYLGWERVAVVGGGGVKRFLGIVGLLRNKLTPLGLSLMVTIIQQKAKKNV